MQCPGLSHEWVMQCPAPSRLHVKYLKSGLNRLYFPKIEVSKSGFSDFTGIFFTMQTASQQRTIAERASVDPQPALKCPACSCVVSRLHPLPYPDSAHSSCEACTVFEIWNCKQPASSCEVCLARPLCNKVPENSHIKYCNFCHCITNELFCGGPDRGVCARCHASGA